MFSSLLRGTRKNDRNIVFWGTERIVPGEIEVFESEGVRVVVFGFE